MRGKGEWVRESVRRHGSGAQRAERKAQRGGAAFGGIL